MVCGSRKRQPSYTHLYWSVQDYRLRPTREGFRKGYILRTLPHPLDGAFCGPGRPPRPWQARALMPTPPTPAAWGKKFWADPPPLPPLPEKRGGRPPLFPPPPPYPSARRLSRRPATLRALPFPNLRGGSRHEPRYISIMLWIKENVLYPALVLFKYNLVMR